MKDNNCIFCKLAAGDIPTNSIYEDEDFKVILDVGPATRGHALILPKDHYPNLYELSNETASKIMILAKKMATEMTEKLACDGFNLIQNNGEAAGQTIFHFHIHLIPRYNNDSVGSLWEPGVTTQEDLEKIKNMF